MATVSDPLTDTNGTALSAHAFPGGYSWTQDLATSGDITINSNRINTIASSGGAVFYSATAIPSSADYTVRAVLDWSPGGSTQFVDLIGRESHVGVGDRYYARFNPAVPRWELTKSVSGTDTVIGTWNTGGATPTTVELVMSGTTISFKADGTTQISVTDSAVSAIGRGGLGYPSSAASSTAIPQITTFEMDATSFSGAASSANFHLMRRRNRR
jgi:hypothetical protein